FDLLGAREAARPGALARAAEAVRERQPVHLGSERPEARLVGAHLPGERHAEERPPVERVLEGDDGGAPAILTAFSTASAPVLTSIVFLGPGPGTIAFRRSASAT